MSKIVRVKDIVIEAFSEESLAELKSLHGEPAAKAAIEHIERQKRTSHPEGEFDSQGRFYISEELECCKNVRRPSASHPFSLMVHGRTLPHCSQIFGADFEAAKQALQSIKRIAKAKGHIQ